MTKTVVFFYYGLMKETFNRLIGDYFQQKRTIPDFVREYYPNDYASKDRAIRRYLTGEVVPQYSIARDLIDKMEIDISEDELIGVLDYSKTVRSTYTSYKHSYLFEKVSLREEELFKDSNYLSYEKQHLFTQRVNEIGEGNIKKYLIKLIEYDLEYNIESDFGNGSQKIKKSPRKGKQPG